jgi:hypothetical protein
MAVACPVGADECGVCEQLRGTNGATQWKDQDRGGARESKSGRCALGARSAYVNIIEHDRPGTMHGIALRRGHGKGMCIGPHWSDFTP